MASPTSSLPAIPTAGAPFKDIPLALGRRYQAGINIPTPRPVPTAPAPTRPAPGTPWRASGSFAGGPTMSASGGWPPASLPTLPSRSVAAAAPRLPTTAQPNTGPASAATSAAVPAGATQPSEVPRTPRKPPGQL
jgi:hypothetical protein